MLAAGSQALSFKSLAGTTGLMTFIVSQANLSLGGISLSACNRGIFLVMLVQGIHEKQGLSVLLD